MHLFRYSFAFSSAVDARFGDYHLSGAGPKWRILGLLPSVGQA